LHSARPIEFQMADDPRDIEAMFDVLTYRKGASVLRMLEQYVGPDVFRAGVRDYLRQHAYGNATTDDLWAALGQAAGRDVAAIMNGWIRQPGYPLISVRLDQDTQQLVLTQQRFTYLNAPLPALADGTPAAREPEQRWQVPIQLRTMADGEITTHQLLLKDAEQRLDLPEHFAAVRVNEGGHGFYRMYYAPELRAGVLRHLPDLSPIERLNLLKDCWAAVLTENAAWRVPLDPEKSPLTEYLDLAARLAQLDREEGDQNVWGWAILIRSFHVLNRIIDPEDRPHLEACVRHRVEPASDGLGWEPRPGESALLPQLRAELLRALGTLGNHRAVQARAVDVYDRYKRNPAAVDGNLAAAVIEILAHAGDGARYEEFFNGYKSPTATPQDKERYLYALAAFRQPDLLQNTLDKTINPNEIRPQDAPAVVRLLLMNVDGRELAWGFVKRHWERMGTLYRQSGLSRVCAGVTGLTTPDLEGDVHQEVRRIKIEGQTLQQYLGGKTLEQYLEQLRIFVQFREREGPALHDYLAQFPLNGGQEDREL
jgi:puromycin-sensitive aminopeptidase